MDEPATIPRMTRTACIAVIGSYLAVGGLGFVEVSCLCAERQDCILPIAEACVVQADPCGDCEDEDCPSMTAQCPCGPCIDLLIASSLVLDLPPSEAGPVVVDTLTCAMPAPVAVEGSWSTPPGPSPPSRGPLAPLRC